MLKIKRRDFHEIEFLCSPDTAKWLRFHLTAKDDMFFRSGGVLQHDEKRRSFLKITPTGCIVLAGHFSKIQSLCADEEIEVEFFKNPLIPAVTPQLPGITLYSYQQDCVKRCFQARRGILRLPTGSGKTEVVFAALRACKRQIQALVLVNRTKLVEQWLKRGEKYGFKMGLIHGKVHLRGEVIIASVQTLRHRLNQEEYISTLRNTGMLVIEECHETTEICETISSLCPNAFLRLGLSGTPETTSEIRNLLIEGILGKVIHSVDPSELTELGVNPNVEYHVRALAHARKGVARNYLTVYNDHFYNHPEMIQDIIQEMDNHPEQNALIFVDYLEHCFTLHSLLQNTVLGKGHCGVEGSQLHLKGLQHSSTSLERVKGTSVRATGIKSIYPGAQMPLHVHARKWSCAYAHAHAREINFEKHNVWIVTPFVSTGFDFQNIHHIFLAGGMKSRNRLIQRIGRGQRRKEPNILKVHDYYIKGMPFIHRHFRQRLKSFQDYYPEAEIIYHEEE